MTTSIRFWWQGMLALWLSFAATTLIPQATFAYDGHSTVAAKTTPKLLGTARDNLLNTAQNPKLRDAINNLYRPGAKVGSGSSMDAYRFEKATGQLLSPTGHGQKLFDRRTQLQKLLHDPNLSPADKQITKDLLIDIQNALGGQ